MNFFTKAKTYFAITGLIANLIMTEASAASFTAIASGSWSSSLTWGGPAPATTIVNDDITIPSGISVTMDSNVIFNGALATLNVGGTLSSSSLLTLRMQSGSVMGSGTLAPGHLILDASSALTFNGTVTVNTLDVSISNLLSTAHYTVSEKLKVAAGILSIQPSGTLNLGANVTIELAGGMLSSGGGTISFTGNYNVVYSAPGNTGIELSGSNLTNLTINTTGSVMSQTDLVINGTLVLTNGELKLNGHHLTIATNILSEGGSGTIHSTNASDITINAPNSVTGNLRFSSGGNTVRNLIINVKSTTQATGTVMLGSDVNISGTINFMRGSLKTGDFTVNLGSNGTITGASDSTYVMTGAFGKLSMNLSSASTTPSWFYIGTDAHYTPVSIQLNAGSSSGSVSANAMGDVLTGGTSGTSMVTAGDLVKNTWNISSDITANINLNAEVLWRASMETNAFNRNQCILSHYTSGSWDVTAVAAATTQTNGMYSLKRTNITSLSPFAVFGKTGTKVAEITKDMDIDYVVYPNPSYDKINVVYHNTINSNTTMDIINMLGEVVYSQKLTAKENVVSVDQLNKGNYVIRFYDNESILLRKFVKL